MNDMTCAVCAQPIEVRQNVVFRSSGRVEHLRCPAPKAAPPPAPDASPEPTCPACKEPIVPVDSVVRDGAEIFHVECFLRSYPSAGEPPPKP
jgi:hypothetical protein